MTLKLCPNGHPGRPVGDLLCGVCGEPLVEVRVADRNPAPARDLYVRLGIGAGASLLGLVSGRGEFFALARAALGHYEKGVMPTTDPVMDAMIRTAPKQPAR